MDNAKSRTSIVVNDHDRRGGLIQVAKNLKVGFVLIASCSTLPCSAIWAGGQPSRPDGVEMYLFK